MTVTLGEIDWRLGQAWGTKKAEAVAKLAAAVDAEAEQSRRVSELREELAAGRVSRGDLVVAQRRLAQLQEAAAQAAARIRVIERDALGERLAKEARTRAAAIDEGKLLAVEAAELDRKIADVIHAAIEGLNRLDRAAGEFEARAIGVKAAGGHPGHVPRPSYQGRDWMAAMAGLERLAASYGNLRS